MQKFLCQNNKLKFTCCSLLLFVSSILLAQENQYKLYTSRQILKIAKSAQQIDDYYNAIELLNYYIEKKGGDAEIYYQLAESYRKSRNYLLASEYYKKAIDTGDKFPEAWFHYADMLMRQGDYAAALNAFESARKNRPERFLSEMINQKITGCKMALQENLTNERIIIIHPDTTINHFNSELSPVFLSRNKVIYGSIRTNPKEKFPVNSDALKLPVSQFYGAEKIGDSDWKQTGIWNFKDEIMHVGNGTFSSDGNRFYFTKCQREWNNKIVCAIYRSERSNTGWSIPVLLENSINIPGYTSTQVTLGRESKRNREVLYFVSDRPGGRGGTDIWYSVYNENEGRFLKPVNAGHKVNTKGDEVTPFYDLRSGTLFFSSDYFPGYGGFDVFMCKGEPRAWTNPENIGDLINTGNDELYYTVNPYQRNEGMFVSNRKGSFFTIHETCCDDLYFYKRETVNKIFIKGTILQDEIIADSVFAGSDVISTLLSDLGSESIIIDSSMIKILTLQKENGIRTDLQPLPKATVSVFMIDDKSDEEIFIFSDSTTEIGEYIYELEPLRNYKIVIKKDEFFNQNLFVSTKVVDWRDTVILQDIALKPVPRKPVKLIVYYDIDSDLLKDGSKKIIDSTLLAILKESPELIVEISSHTDSTGLESYNSKLSQKRAETVVNYLIEKGIDKNRLIAIGYGDSRPVADNSTEEGRSLNRRTEFKVVGSIDQFSKLNVTDLKIINTIEK